MVFHRSTGSSLSISFKILYFSWMILVLSIFSTSPPCFGVECFDFFSVPRFQMFMYSNFQVANIRMPHLSEYFMLRVNDKCTIQRMASLIRVPVKRNFLPERCGKFRGHASPATLNKSSSYPGSYLTEVYSITLFSYN